ncbi:hypothetical protein TNIN_423351 [Trichonephila inaurata madagascariensis]|uniref:Uncharacterized protein n=1 Tax=Trichonephila inaurata madagascariensis TaxID=2747483 RepID=A0A8X7C993_9ARAC|nr:hypothetical protein TNIN_423351 [Trichonephila inaurata madagascariensis]
MDELDIPSQIEQLLLPINPLGASRILYNLDLMSHVLKSQNRTATCSMRNRRLSIPPPLFGGPQESVLCFVSAPKTGFRVPASTLLNPTLTDGSKLIIDDVPVAGVYSEHFFHYLSLGTTKTTFADEVEAIKVALAFLNARPSLSVQTVIFLNSQAAILAFAECSQTIGSISVLEYRHLLGEMHTKY